MTSRSRGRHEIKAGNAQATNE